MLKPTFSIIIPVYNAQNTISRSIESVLLQEMQDFELILVNDGSSDNSLQICKKYAKDNPKIRVIDKKNGGVSSARNEGINNSNGEYVVFLDSDDTISPKLLKLFYKVIEEQYTDLVFCNFAIVTNAQSIPNKVDVEEVSSKKDISSQFEKLYNANLLNCCWGKCYKRKLINYKFDSKLQLGEDFLFVLSYLENAKTVYYINQELYNYYVLSENTLSFAGGIKRLENLYAVYDESTNVLRKIFPVDSYRYAIERKFCINILDSVERIAKSGNVKKSEKMRVFDHAIDSLKHLEYIEKALESIDEKFKAEYKLLEQGKYNIYIMLCKGIGLAHSFKVKIVNR